MTNIFFSYETIAAPFGWGLYFYLLCPGIVITIVGAANLSTDAGESITDANGWACFLVGVIILSVSLACCSWWCAFCRTEEDFELERATCKVFCCAISEEVKQERLNRMKGNVIDFDDLMQGDDEDILVNPEVRVQ